MTVLNIGADARRAMDAMQNAGIAILPNDVGYSLIAACASALRKIFDTKKRAPSKLNAMPPLNKTYELVHNALLIGKAALHT